MAIGKEIFKLEDKLGYKFADIKHLETALTHASYSNEQKSKGMHFPSNERYEFLGDAVLEIIISEYLFDNFKNQTEGALTKMRQYLVCEKTLSKIAAEINLGEYINLGRGEEMTDCRNRPKVLADALEAVFAAVYLDSAGETQKCRDVVLSIMSEEILNSASMQKGDYKTLLQQLVEKDGHAILEYVLLSEKGPEHKKIFKVCAKVNNNIVGEGEATSKKDAEMQAAKSALLLFGISI
ncbi:MAG: ribonuclease III [Ruminococcaceae bacterium]|nr:ribonuclease III [Oscillospiraceae bacterium]